MSCINHSTRPVINKKYSMCMECNYQRIHGRSQQEVYIERASQKERKIYTFKPQTKPIKQQTKKQSKRAQDLSVVKSNIEMDAVLNGTYFCQGCGISYVGLDKSHILSVGQRKDLELVPTNMNLFCRACHNAWESGDILKMVRLHSFEKDVQFILEHDVDRYGAIVNKIKHYLQWHSDVDSDEIRKMKSILKIFCETVA